jgi:uncharacterized protein with NAD-binding domain and iron-sulfur cluster
MHNTAKKKIAILGGGVGAMTTAWQITSEPGWQERYEVTVYQMGWRLGGKGASGRRAPNWRIEEHGLHIWLGFYHNAFRMMQAALEEINPQAGPAPVGNTPPRMATGVFLRCEDAFQPHSYVGAYHQFDGRAVPWMVEMPTNDERPWQGQALPTVWSYLQGLVQLLLQQAGDTRHASVYAHEDLDAHQGLMGWLRNTAQGLALDAVELGECAGMAALTCLARTMATLPADVRQHTWQQHALLEALLARLQAWVAHEFERLTAQDLEGRRHLLMKDFLATTLRGLLVDQVLDGQRLYQLDEEIRTWLRRHGAMPATVDTDANPLLRVFYDFVFAFRGGSSADTNKTADFATAPTLRTLFRMCCTYNGAIFWKMRAGMGDTIFTPLYKALTKRGVQFKFFHKVEQLALSPDGGSVQSIHMARQVTTTQAYQPLVRVKGLDCWPSVAQYGQLVEGAALKEQVERQRLDLESLWFNWRDAERFTLEKGRDFDTVVFGISLGSVPLLCEQLCRANPRWQRMVDKVRTVCTAGVQLWLKPRLEELGWRAPSPIIDAFYEPLDTWADMSHLLTREEWPEVAPQNVAYFCGALDEGPLDPADRATPYRALAKVEAATGDLLAAKLQQLWPQAVDGAGALPADLVVTRYQRANVDPSERYVLSVAGSEGARIKANATGFDNLVITGDWIDNGFNAGCVEASAMAGMQAGNAVLGRDLYDGVIGQELC